MCFIFMAIASVEVNSAGTICVRANNLEKCGIDTEVGLPCLKLSQLLITLSRNLQNRVWKHNSFKGVGNCVAVFKK